MLTILEYCFEKVDVHIIYYYLMSQISLFFDCEEEESIRIERG